jgi:enolase
MSKIRKITAREVLDSRGNPTVEVEVCTKHHSGRAIVPSGASKGFREAVEIRDHGSRFHGEGVLNAVHNVRDVLAPKLVGLDCRNQDDVDKLMIELDGTANKSKIGANAILGVSMAVARAAAEANEIPLYKHLGALCKEQDYVLPVPCMNVINGGAHAGNHLDVQEFMIMPVGASSFGEAVRMCCETYQTLRTILQHIYGRAAINVGDEGGFAPPIRRTVDVLKIIAGAIRENDYEGKILLGLDMAASQLYHEGVYRIDGQELSYRQLIDYYERICGEFPIASIEDPFEEEAFSSFAELTSALGSKVQIVGDDLLVTNVVRVQKAIEQKACNALLLKMNQVGTVSEAIRAAKLARSHDFAVMVSHRSGETEDSFIADLAVGLSAGQMKSGAPCRGERTAKYNQLLRIEESLGDKAVYAGRYFRNPKLRKLEFSG